MTQEKVGVLDVQSFRSWEQLSDREAKVCRHLCILTWCEGLVEGRVSVKEIARAVHTTPRLAEDALRSLYERGALSRLHFLTPGLAIVALTQRWRLEETP